MSEQQKLFASLSGAFVAHLIFFVFVFGLLSTRTANSSSSRAGEAAEKKKEPQEVTILMSDLMEKLEVEPAPPAEPEPTSRAFVSTDLNAPEEKAPLNARFQSDRNTSAASALRPDETRPQEDLPTLDGKNPFPHLTLANRDYIDGRESAPAAAMSPNRSTTPAASAPASMAASAGREGADDENLDGAEVDPVAAAADRVLRPESAAAADEAIKSRDELLDRLEQEVEANTRKSFLDPNTDPDAPDPGKMTTEEDMLASSGGAVAQTGETADEAKAKNLPGSSGEAEMKPDLKPADEGLFSESFSPEERQNAINGSLARIGQNAVDAEATPLGRYQKSVRDIISQKWNRYRQDNADFVTWGILKIEFVVDQDGRVNHLQIIKNEANAILAEFSLKAIREAKLPPMPAEVVEALGSQGLVFQYDIIIY